MKCYCDNNYCPFYSESIYDDDCCLAGIYPNMDISEDGYPAFYCSLSKEDVKTASDKISDVKEDLRRKLRKANKNTNSN